MSLLPLPFEQKGLPVELQNNIDDTGTAFCEKIDDIFGLIESEIKGLLTLKDVDKCPDSLLDYFGYEKEAGILAHDTAIQKRGKIREAIQTHKNRCLWTSLKANIDNITGGDANLLSRLEADTWLIMSDDVLQPCNYSTTVSDDTEAWARIISSGAQLSDSGNLVIDINSPGFTEWDILEDELRKDPFAYFILHVGYIDTNTFMEVITI